MRSANDWTIAGETADREKTRLHQRDHLKATALRYRRQPLHSVLSVVEFGTYGTQDRSSSFPILLTRSASTALTVLVSTFRNFTRDGVSLPMGVVRLDY